MGYEKENQVKDDLMVQQQVKTVWQHMVGVICLNLTYRKQVKDCLLYTSPSPRDNGRSRMPSSA